MARKLPEDILAWLRNMATCRRGGDWGPDPVVCRFCYCWLYSKDQYGKVTEVHAGAHRKECLAVKYLGAPTAKRTISCSCVNKVKYGAHEKHCGMYEWKEPYL